MKNAFLTAVALLALTACGTKTDESGTRAVDGPSLAMAPSVDAPSSTERASKAEVASADAKANLALVDVGRMAKGVSSSDALALGEGFPLRYIDQVALRTWNGEPSEAISFPVSDRVYPVLSLGKVVASITLHKTNGKWETMAIGEGSSTGRLIDARNALRASRTVDGDYFEIVHVVGLNDRFIAHHEQRVGFFTSLKSAAAEPQPESLVLADLAARARTRTLDH